MIDELIKNIISKENPTVVGLDTSLDYVPSYLTEKYEDVNGLDFHGASLAIIEFNKAIIDAVCDLIPAVKIQAAYYESYGVEGMIAFYETINYAKSKSLVVIGDVKRNDIDSTAKAYSTAYLGKTKLHQNKDRAFSTDFITINPYLGFDGVKPFLEDCKEYNKGVFILVKTSNPSSGDFQDLISGDKRIFEIVADKVKEWGQNLIGDYDYSQVGAVVGATYPSQGVELRQRMPNTFFLVPGYGVQGGGVKDIIGCFDSRGHGAVINASRSVICAYKREPWKQKYDEHGFAEAARAEVISMRNDIETGLFQNGMKPW